MAAFLNLDGLALTTSQGKGKRTADAVVRDVVKSNAERVDREGTFPAENIRALADAGLLSLQIPVEQGGAGESILTSVLVTEAIAKGCAATAMVYHMHQTALPLICAVATPE